MYRVALQLLRQLDQAGCRRIARYSARFSSRFGGKVSMAHRPCAKELRRQSQFLASTSGRAKAGSTVRREERSLIQPWSLALQSRLLVVGRHQRGIKRCLRGYSLEDQA